MERLTSSIGRTAQIPGERIVRAGRAYGLSIERLREAESEGYDRKRVEKHLDWLEGTMNPNSQLVAASLRGAINDLLDRLDPSHIRQHR